MSHNTGELKWDLKNYFDYDRFIFRDANGRPFFQGVITLLMLATDNVYVLIGYTAFVESFFTAVSVAGLLYLR